MNTNIVFTRDCAVGLKEKLEDVPFASLYLLADSNTSRFCLGHLGLDMFPVARRMVMPAGEDNKTLDTVARIWQWLSVSGARRNAVLLNVGGGVVSDMGGFAASCFKRGIRCVNVPTTLLAQVDASVGGKTGIDFNGLKNEIGTFSFPQWVLVDNGFLATLPFRQVLSGFAEMLKHALLAGNGHLEELLRADLSQVAEEPFLHLIEKSVAVKAEIVERDPEEQGVRKALNFGHTVGHAIESAAIAGGMEMYHGEAVAYGMVAELYLSVRKMGFDRQRYEAIRRFIQATYLPYVPVAGAEELYGLMLHDKKNEREGVNFSLLRAPGLFEVNCYCSREEILEALKEISHASDNS